VSRRRAAAALAACGAALALLGAAFQDPGGFFDPRPAKAKKDVPYVPTPHAVVERMIELAELREGDVLYDLGCGDGRIVIAAVQRPGVRGVCVDIDPVLVQESRTNAKKAGVEDRIRFVEGDLFQLSLADATVITMYLLPEVNLRLRPRLLALPPGTRIVSHAFDLGDWKPEREIAESGSLVYRWTVPPRGVEYPRASSSDPWLADTLVGRATAARAAGNLDAAVTLYREAMEADRRHGAAGLLISTLEEAGRVEEAMELGRRYHHVGPRNVPALFRYARLLANLWETAEAEALYRVIVQMDEGREYEAWGHGELAQLARARGDHAEAVRAMETAVDRRPTDGPSRIGHAQMLLEAGRTAEALRILQRELAQDPEARGRDGLPAALLLGWAHRQQGDAEAARKAVDPLFRGIADAGEPVRLMQLYVIQGRREDALALAEQTPSIPLHGGPELRDRLLDTLRGDARFDALVERSRARVEGFRARLGLRPRPSA
jgi:tetratricopeptide (TPR) repeat protein